MTYLIVFSQTLLRVQVDTDQSEEVPPGPIQNNSIFSVVSNQSVIIMLMLMLENPSLLAFLGCVHLRLIVISPSTDLSSFASNNIDMFSHTEHE